MQTPILLGNCYSFQAYGCPTLSAFETGKTSKQNVYYIVGLGIESFFFIACPFVLPETY